MAGWELQEKMHAGECLRFYEGLWPTAAAAAVTNDHTLLLKLFIYFIFSPGWINTFLSWNFWVPVGRLTYTVYLVHPIIVRNILFSQSNAYYAIPIPIVSF